jgi:hypothetical protein
MSRRKGFDRGTGLENFITGAVENVISSAGSVATVKPSAKYMTGARTVLKINGNIVGFAMQVSWTVSTEQVEIYTIDDYMPYEIVPKRVSVNGTLGMFMVPGRSPTAEIIQSDNLSFLFNKYITIEVRDSVTDNLLFKTNKAVITSSSADLRADQLGSMTLQWRAIGWINESSPQIPAGWNNTSQQNTADPINATERLKKKFGI